MLSPVLIAYEAASLTLAMLRGWLPSWARASMWQVRHTPEIRARRRRMQRMRVLPDRDVLTGGPIPLAPALVQVPTMARAVGVLSAALNVYWRCVRRLIG